VKIEDWLEIITVVAIIARLLKGKKMEIAQGESGDVKYDVSFVGGKLVAKVSDDKVGASDALSIDGALVVNALIDMIDAKYPSVKGIGEMVKGIIDAALAAQV
jgi:hypothetical protein